MRATLTVRGENEFTWVRSNIKGRNVKEILDRVIPALDRAPADVDNWTHIELTIEKEE